MGMRMGMVLRGQRSWRGDGNQMLKYVSDVFRYSNAFLSVYPAV